MGEVVVSSDDTVGREAESPGNDGGAENKGGSFGGVVKWEKFLPRMVLRVLLVEADDSTRQIIAALLRKCSYRVAAVPDGLKAWELLKGRPHNIDLILTEVDLPSIAGFSLLTLVMEHDICKNIPVIMMSSQDSISTVYKCMMRGAADYLVKPIRTNELKNLWQHVWRRQSSTAGTSGQQDENAALQKIEATAENNAASNHSSGNRDKELIEKGSDAQSSCTKPDLDADIAEIEQQQDYNVNEVKILAPEAVRSNDGVSIGPEKGSDGLGEGKSSRISTQNKDANPETPRRNAKVAAMACDNNDVTINSYKEAINLIGAFDNNPRSLCVDSFSNYGTRKSDVQPELGLSLRQSDPSCLTNQKNEERHILKHSDASAFSRYVNKPLHSPQSGLGNLRNQEQEFVRSSDEDASYAAKVYNPDSMDAVQGTGNGITSVGSTQTRQSQYFVQHPQQRVFPAPIPVRGVRFDNTDYGSVYPQAYCTQSGPSPTPSPTTAGQREPLLHGDSFQPSSCENNNFECLRDQPDQNASNSSNQSRLNPELKFDSLDDRGHISPATDRSASSSFCNGTLTRRSSMDCGSICASNENVNQVPVSKHAGESWPGEDTSQRSTQREAALAKFRLKRKDRCYEKKVRYESRKKLAEQRPRVKGQFVRQVQIDPVPGETNS